MSDLLTALAVVIGLLSLAQQVPPPAARQPSAEPTADRAQIEAARSAARAVRAAASSLTTAVAPAPLTTADSRATSPAALLAPVGDATRRREAPGGAAGRHTRHRMGRDQPPRFMPHAPFSVILIGSGGPVFDPLRAGPSTAIQHRGQIALVDMGNGTRARLFEAGIDPAQMGAFLVTHHHCDHNDELPPMLHGVFVHNAPLDVIGPPGTTQLADFTLKFYAEDIAYRRERLGIDGESSPKPRIRELQGGESFALEGMLVKTARVPHSIHTVAYRFEAGAQSIVVSGDLTYSEELIALARGTDVLVLDSGGSVVRKSLPAHSGGPLAIGRGHGRPAHPSLQDVRRMAQRAHAKKLVLTHIAPGEVDEAATIAAVRQGFDGQVIVAHDLLEVTPGDR